MKKKTRQHQTGGRDRWRWTFLCKIPSDTSRIIFYNWQLLVILYHLPLQHFHLTHSSSTLKQRLFSFTFECPRPEKQPFFSLSLKPFSSYEKSGIFVWVFSPTILISFGFIQSVSSSLSIVRLRHCGGIQFLTSFLTFSPLLRLHKIKKRKEKCNFPFFGDPIWKSLQSIWWFFQDGKPGETVTQRSDPLLPAC